MLSSNSPHLSLPKLFWSTVAFVFLVLISNPINVRAQCPTGYVGPLTTTMTVWSPTCGTNINITVEYCYTGSGVSPQGYYISKISTTSIGPGGISCIDGAVLREAGRNLIQSNPAGFTCPSGCPSSNFQLRATWAVCHRTYQDPGTGEWITIPCFVANEGCADVFKICCQPGPDATCGTSDDIFTAYYLTTIQSDQCSEPDEQVCSLSCPSVDPPEPFVCP